MYIYADRVEHLSYLTDGVISYHRLLQLLGAREKYKNKNINPSIFSSINFILNHIIYHLHYADDILFRALSAYLIHVDSKFDDIKNVLKYFDMYITYWPNSVFTKAILDNIRHYCCNLDIINQDLQTLLNKIYYYIKNMKEYYSSSEYSTILDELDFIKNTLNLKYLVSLIQKNNHVSVVNFIQSIKKILDTTKMSDYNKLQYYYSLYISFQYLKINDIAEIYYHQYLETLKKIPNKVEYTLSNKKIIYKTSSDINNISNFLSHSLTELYVAFWNN